MPPDSLASSQPRPSSKIALAIVNNYRNPLIIFVKLPKLGGILRHLTSNSRVGLLVSHATRGILPMFNVGKRGHRVSLGGACRMLPKSGLQGYIITYSPLIL